MDHRRWMEEERRAILTENEERFRAIYNGVNEAICMYEAGSRAVLSVNGKMCQTYGYSAAEFARLSMGDLGAGEPSYSPAEARAWMNRSPSPQF
jgi:PAS domain S-box-containing protein